MSQPSQGVTEAQRLRISTYSEAARNRIVISTALAVEGLKSMVLVNGGAIVALFTLIAQGSQSAFVKQLPIPLVLVAFAAFALGLAFCIASFIAGFWSQQLISMIEQDQAEQQFDVMGGFEQRVVKDTDIDKANGLLNVAAIIAVGSLVSFLVGAGVALWAAIKAI